MKIWKNGKNHQNWSQGTFLNILNDKFAVSHILLCGHPSPYIWKKWKWKKRCFSAEGGFKTLRRQFKRNNFFSMSLNLLFYSKCYQLLNVRTYSTSRFKELVTASCWWKLYGHTNNFINLNSIAIKTEFL